LVNFSKFLSIKITILNFTLPLFQEEGGVRSENYIAIFQLQDFHCQGTCSISLIKSATIYDIDNFSNTFPQALHAKFRNVDDFNRFQDNQF
jgi:hypothetical protein